jgi:hypothetical protein
MGPGVRTHPARYAPPRIIYMLGGCVHGWLLARSGRHSSCLLAAASPSNTKASPSNTTASLACKAFLMGSRPLIKAAAPFSAHTSSQALELTGSLWLVGLHVWACGCGQVGWGEIRLIRMVGTHVCLLPFGTRVSCLPAQLAAAWSFAAKLAVRLSCAGVLAIHPANHPARPNSLPKHPTLCNSTGKPSPE